MKASDIMTPGVISADPDATVLHAARYMLQHHISAFARADFPHSVNCASCQSEQSYCHGRQTRVE
jgi:CBS-domain-containing membrane protein